MVPALLNKGETLLLLGSMQVMDALPRKGRALLIALPPAEARINGYNVIRVEAQGAGIFRVTYENL